MSATGATWTRPVAARFGGPAITDSPRPAFNAAADFGAIGDGVTDDAAAIQAALNAAQAAGGGTVYVPRGTYRLTTFLTHKSRVEITGDGMGQTILKRGNSADVAALIYLNGQTNCRVSRLTLDGNAANNATLSGLPAGEILDAGSTDTIIEDVEVKAFRQMGIAILSATRVKIRRCAITGANATGTSLSGIYCPGNGGTFTSHLLVEGCWILNCSLTAIQAGPCTLAHNYIKGNAFDASGGQIFVHGDGGGLSQVLNNFIEDGGATFSAGIEIGGNVIVSGNVIDDSQLSGIYLHGPIPTPDLATNGQAIITNNIVRNACRASPANGSGIYVSPNITDFTIALNAIFDTGTARTVHGITVDVGTSDRYVIEGNRITNVTGAAVNDLGTGVAKYLRNP